VSSGETDAALHLTRWFEQLGVPTEHLTAYQWAAQDITQRHVILFGNRRTFPDIAQLLTSSACHFRIEEHRITNSDTPEGNHPDVFSSNKPIHGLVSRFELEDRECWVTVFGSNHGRFFEAAVRALTNDVSVRWFWHLLGVEESILPPPKFEAIGEAVVTAHDQIHRSHSLQWVASRPNRDLVAVNSDKKEQY